MSEQSLDTRNKKINRRTYLKFSSFTLASSLLLKNKFAFSSTDTDTDTTLSECENQGDIKENTNTIRLSDDQIFTWISGPKGLGLGSIAFFIRILHSQNNYISRVILTDSSKTTIASRYFSKASKTYDHYLPYIIFDNILIDEDYYYLFILKYENAKESVYRYTLSPDKINQDNLLSGYSLRKIERSFTATSKSKYSSKFSINKTFFNKSFCSNYTNNTCQQQYDLITYFSNITSNRKFELTVEHTLNSSTNHYIDLFILTDPVGRILGIKKIKLDQTMPSKVTINELSLKDKSDWQISQAYIANISFCPYVYLFWQDSRHGLRQRYIWLNAYRS